jgi:hypothetical protein
MGPGGSGLRILPDGLDTISKPYILDQLWQLVAGVEPTPAFLSPRPA